MSSVDGFSVVVSGQIKSCEIRGSRKAYCSYQLVYGHDWTVLEGHKEGLTQLAIAGRNRELIWNFPLSVLLRGRNAFGWPQIVVCVYGLDIFGRDIVIGYGSVHFPITAGQHVIEVKLYKPKSTSIFQRIFEFAVGMPPEFVSVTFPSEKEGRDVVQTCSNGKVTVELNMLLKDNPFDKEVSTGRQI